jgi:DHA2 family multidrug resistance protein
MKGAGVGLVFTMLPGITFSTLDPALRNEGAAFNALVRNMGMSVGVSITQIFALHEAAWTRSRLAEGFRPDNPAMIYGMPTFDFDSASSVTQMSYEISRQATMVGYVNAFLVAGFLAFALVPLVMLMRVRR